ncbi:MAG: hypothetical protein RRC34_09625 [Lentisphaeria bacterium]|nr:hypothetical protein [Lentisphaeria bacterium]
MTYESIYQSVLALPVFDTHTHLESGWRQPTKGLHARNFFDICRYFWFQRELEAAGYQPPAPEDDPDAACPEQAKALHEALGRVRNTTWTRTVMEAMENLYGIRPDSVDRILELSDKMGRNLSTPDWGYQVCDKIGIRKTVIGPPPAEAEPSIALIKKRTICVPALSIGGFLKDIDLEHVDPRKTVDDLKSQISARVEAFHVAGVRTVRVAWPFHPDQDKAVRKDFSVEELRDTENLTQHLGHVLFGLFEQHGFSLQIFFGMESPGAGPLSDARLIRTYARNDTGHVAAMHNIFEMYLGIRFELFCAAELSSLDMVQAARIYPNVYPGGLWWFNFRRSVYEKNMQYRVEALPASRVTFVASDARCVEWSYIKTLLIKKLMARFFYNQIREGWMDEDAALYTARHWLHDTAERLYRP